MNSRMANIEKQTLNVYTRNADAFDRQRAKGLHEWKWLSRFAAHVVAGGTVLDVGCGAGEPIAEYFITEGFDVTGVDFSESMLALARTRFPKQKWLHCDMRELALGSTFDGIIAWNSFFHLTQEDQRDVLDLFVQHLNPGGVLMLTVGPDAGEVIGHVNGEEVFHASLSPSEYTAILNNNGLEIVEFVFEDEECDFQTVLLAKR